MAFGSAWAWQLIKGWSLDVLLLWMANLGMSSEDQSSLSDQQSPTHKTRGIVAPHTGLLLRTSWQGLAESSLSVQQHQDREQLFKEDSTRRHPLPDLGQPCVHVPAQSCFRAIQPTHRAACKSDISPWSPLLTPGFRAGSTMLPSPPHPSSPWAIPSSAKRQSAESCFVTEQRAMPEWGKCKGGSHRLVDKNMIKSPSLPFFRGQTGISYSKTLPWAQ